MDRLPKQITPSRLSHDSAPTQMTGFRRDPQDTKDFRRVILGGGYAGVSAPAKSSGYAA
jgi:hypothetical protein